LAIIFHYLTFPLGWAVVTLLSAEAECVCASAQIVFTKMYRIIIYKLLL